MGYVSIVMLVYQRVFIIAIFWDMAMDQYL